MKKGALLLLICLQFIISCRKEVTANDCQNLEDGISTNSIEKVKLAINNMINQLPGKDYNSESLTALAQRISSQCNVICEVICFNCIQTLPSQSEIKIRLSSEEVLVEKVIDISYTTTNTMTFRNMHD